MPVTRDYVKELDHKTISSIKSRYANHESCWNIGKALNLSGGIVNKILLQEGCYDPYRFARSAFYVRAEELVIEAYSNDEMDYGYSGQCKYTYDSLSLVEKIMYNEIK